MNRTHAIRITAAGSLLALLAGGFAAAGARAQGTNARGLRVKATRPRGEPPRTKGDERARAFVEEGLRYADEGKWDEAVSAYKQAVGVDPRYSDAYVNLGDAYMSSGKYREGFAAYRQAIEAAPRNADAFYSLGAAFNDMGQHGEAFKPFVTALSLRPDFAEAHYGIGFAYLRLDNFREALPYLRRAVRLMPDDADAHLALGQTYLGLRDAKAAEAELRILADLDAGAARLLEKEIHGASSLAREPASPRPTQDDVAKPRQERAVPLKPEPAATPKQETAAAAAAAPPAREPEAEPPAKQGQRLPRDAREGAEVRPAAPQPTEPPRQKSTAAAAPAQPSNAGTLLAVELSFWDSIKRSSDPEEFVAYLRKYPNGQFADLARIRVRALAPNATPSRSEGAPPPQQQAASGTASLTPERPSEVAAAPVVKEPVVKEPVVKEAEAYVGDGGGAAEGGVGGAPEKKVASPAAEKVRPPAPAPRTEPAQTVEAALELLRTVFPTRFTYRAATAGPPPSTSDVSINYVPLQFDGCRIEWRDANDTIAASLSELDPDALKVARRIRPGTTFSAEVWDVSIAALGGRGAITETKGDGSGAVNRYNGLDLQYGDRARADRVAAALRRAIELCVGK